MVSSSHTLAFLLCLGVQAFTGQAGESSLEGVVMQQSAALNKLQAEVAALKHRVETEIPALQKLAASKPVAFHADFLNYTDHNYNISDSGIIAFDNIIINEGRGYDNQTGYFTAPVAGLYSFSVRYEMSAAYYLFVSLMTKDGYQAFGVVGDAVWQSGGGLSSLLQLAQGERVWVERYMGSATWLLPGHRSSFSGFLIHQS